jgi:hypothetical protein
VRGTPIWARVRRTGRWDCSTTRMISSFSEAGYLIRGRPQPRSCFFEKAVLEGQRGHHLLERQRLGAQVLDLRTGRLPGSVPGQSFLAGLEKSLRPAAIQALGDPLAAAQLCNAVLTTKAGQDDAGSRVLSNRWRSPAHSLPRCEPCGSRGGCLSRPSRPRLSSCRSCATIDPPDRLLYASTLLIFAPQGLR